MNQYDPNNPTVDGGPYLVPVPTAQHPLTRRPVRWLQFTGAPNTVPGNSSPIFDGTRFVWLNGTKTFPYTAATSKIVDAPAGANTARVYLSIRNTDAAQTLYVDFGQNSSSLSGIALLPGETIAYDQCIPQDDIYVSGTGAGTVAVLYSNAALPV